MAGGGPWRADYPGVYWTESPDSSPWATCVKKRRTQYAEHDWFEMTPKLETWGIVLAGHWNRMIFTPEWVGANLFQQETIETEIALLPVFPVIYRHTLVTLEAGGGRLVFRPRVDSVHALDLSEQMAVTVLRELPNTPLMGVGVNFSFTETNPSDALLELFNLQDASYIAREGWEAPEIKLSRKLTGEHGTMLLSLGYNGVAVDVDINFHSETPGNTVAANAAARAAVEGRILRLKGAALDFLSSIYHLRLEEGEGNG